MGKYAPLYVIALLSFLATGEIIEARAQADFLPFGVGDTLNPKLDDGSSQAISLQQPFKYFGSTYNQIFVNNNGHLTFTEPLYSYNPILKSERDIIAPLWTDLDNRQGGTISYREDTSSDVLAQVTAAVKEYFPDVTFAATSAFVATWDSVPYYNGEGVVTFQVVLAYNFHRSFILFNYGDIAATTQSWMGGTISYREDTSSAVLAQVTAAVKQYFPNIPFAATTAFVVTWDSVPYHNGGGVVSFQVVLAYNVHRSFILIYYGGNAATGQPWQAGYNTVDSVNNDGHLTFSEPLSNYIPLLSSGRDIIAPLWTHLDNRRGGTISYREDTSSAVLAQVTAAVEQYFSNVTFAATSAFVATWDSVPYYDGGGVATFQVGLASSVHRSFILINYGDIAETNQTWQAGYSTVDSVNSFTIPVPSAPELSSSSNINVNGRCSFHVDGSPNCWYKHRGLGQFFHNSSQPVSLNYHQASNIKVTAGVGFPVDGSPIHIIAPLWTHLDNRRGGTVSYREDTSSAVLAQVTAAVEQYFPNVTFAATSAFVATWDSVPYYNGGGVATFQVVLASSVHRSFILINYGDIAETNQTWQAGYSTVDSVNSFTVPVTSAPELSSSSNINVNGRCSFHVDCSPNLPTNFLPPGNEEIVKPPAGDGSSDVIFLQQPFKYFGRTFNQIFVNNNGYLTFTEPLSAYNSSLDSARDIIAPLWTRLDNRQGGTISYREDTSSAVLAQVTAAVKQYYPNIPFAATTAFVVTWDSVPYHNGGGVVSFQVVLAYNVHRSFILIYYGGNAATGQPWQAGYNTVDSVNNDGHLTFSEPLSNYIPLLSSGRDIIAPLWTHLDNRRGGTISYREDTSSAVLAQVTAAVEQYFSNVTFAATSAFVATWDSVPYYDGGGVATFQVVLASSVHRSFILINYGDIAETNQTWQAGYSTVDSVNSFTVPVTSAPELSSSSNINVNGRCSFHVDGSPNLPTNFLPPGNEEIVKPPAGDGSSDVIFLQQPFKYFGRTFNQIFVNNNGYLTFTEPLSAYNPSLDSARDIIAPLWTRLDNRQGGTISYREDTSSAVLAQVTAAVKQYFPNIPFAATTAFVVTWDSVPYHNGGGAGYNTVDSVSSFKIPAASVSELSSSSNINVTACWSFHVDGSPIPFVATWDSVPYYNGGGVATFQVVLASSVHRSFILINYGDIAETNQTWQAGYSTVDSVNSFTVPVTSAPELSSSSNINVNGRCSFHVDGSPNLPTNFLPPGNEEVVKPPAGDGSSDVIFLQQPFKYFGRTFNQIFVNNNGYLTFTEPLSAYTPSLDSARAIIAPLWTHLDNRQGGAISYREDTSSAVLAQVTAAVKHYFPNIPFAATTAFVVTWDSVPYHSGGGVVSFQVVLAYNVHRSFILIYYGDNAATGQPWQAGYNTVDSVSSFKIPAASVSELSSSSNINVTACWSFHVDGSPILCNTLDCTGNEVCRFRDGYGCGCLEGQRPNPETFDALEFCASSTGTISLSSCQLFESGFPPEILHLNDPSCKGVSENGRVLFHFDNEGHVCGTTLSSNGTHFIYQNTIQSTLPKGVITRERWINISFSCAYPLIQNLSMPKEIQAEHGGPRGLKSGGPDSPKSVCPSGLSTIISAANDGYCNLMCLGLTQVDSCSQSNGVWYGSYQGSCIHS
ncbi:nidogen and EGF-like domain-containing [Labeo rohita]|uniref:Nidogen and EGF-like domain-containing n=1 Tax=Labeo rohita TaxID=84645 RepID=A0A498MKV9_LABRO|nr:nidogen and EGF-like domain-containing [Labeo rohita]